MLRSGETAYDLLLKCDVLVEAVVDGMIVVNGESFPHDRFVRPALATDRRSWLEKEKESPDGIARAAKREAEKEARGDSPLLDFAEALTLSAALMEKMPSLLECKDWNGHWGSGTALPISSYSKEFWLDRGLKEDFRFRVITKEQAVAYQHFIDTGEWTLEPEIIRIGMSSECTYCGKGYKVSFDGTWKVVGAPCKYPEGLPTTTWELNVPSGKLVVANDLRDVFPMSESVSSVNMILGQHETALAYSRVGMSHASVGNSCPSVYRRDAEHYTISGGVPEEYKSSTYLGKEGDEYKYENVEWAEGEYEAAVEAMGEDVASICTDLWWYSIVDYDEYIRRSAFVFGEDSARRVKEELDGWTVSVVDVKPGVYKFVHNNARDDDTTEYATFEWVRAPDELTDYVTREAGLEAPPEKVLVAAFFNGYSFRDKPREEILAKWNAMDDDAKAQSLAYSADRILNSREDDWHETGQPRYEAPEFDLPEYEIPQFLFQQSHWSTCDSAGFCMPTIAAGLRTSMRFGTAGDKLHPDWIRLSYNVLQSILSYGVTPRESEGYEWDKNDEGVKPTARWVAPVRKRMFLAAVTYLRLRERNPDVPVMDVAFDRWMNGGCWMTWVLNYQLDDPSRPDEVLLYENPGSFEWYFADPNLLPEYSKKRGQEYRHIGISDILMQAGRLEFITVSAFREALALIEASSFKEAAEYIQANLEGRQGAALEWDSVETAITHFLSDVDKNMSYDMFKS